MTSKEKAEKLVNSFIGLSSNKLSDYSRIEHPTAKQCAILVVDEMLNLRYLLKQETYFYRRVKKEIELL